ncbi:MAG: GDP-mannose 4,6-dehydratase [Ignavibacteria bacterium]|nr:GDP-mannose 4,6-dehydratase [Ignavibacteria bacterium]
MNILVTGGAGFIGSHVIEQLLANGHTAVCIDNFDDFYDPNVKRRNLETVLQREGFRLVEGDIRDQSALEQCFSGKPVDVVIHLAARAGVRPSLLQPELYYDVNVMGTLRLLEMMHKHDVSRLLFASSSSVYGNNRKIPFSETDSVDNPISPYAASKKAGELLCHTYHHLYGFDIHCMRFFTVYGPRQRPEMAIHEFVKKITREEPIVLYGDGTSLRDYTYISDILDGIMKSVDNLEGYEIFNLGESRTIALSELVATIENVVVKKAIIQRQPMQPGDVQVTFADITKAKRILGYQPCCSVESGLEKFIEWFQKTNHI